MGVGVASVVVDADERLGFGQDADDEGVLGGEEVLDDRDRDRAVAGDLAQLPVEGHAAQQGVEIDADHDPDGASGQFLGTATRLRRRGASAGRCGRHRRRRRGEQLGIGGRGGGGGVSPAAEHGCRRVGGTGRVRPGRPGRVLPSLPVAMAAMVMTAS